MKTLKKSIVVLLVLVMALGMIPLVGASDYDDDEDINYDEAVDVLTGISVLEGYEGGAFKPQQLVTRAEAAIIITRLVLGRKLADTLPDGLTGFPDVDGKGYGWALKYIGYCVTQGIMIGYPNGNFGPNDPVTATQFAVMGMRILKIGDAAGYEGPGWEFNAVIEGLASGILAIDDDVNFTSSSNREEIAQYAFNMLTFSPSGKTDKIWALKYVDPDTGEHIYGWEIIPGDDPDSIKTKVYPTLKLVGYDEGRDDLGRPTYKWSYTKANTVIHSKVAKPIKVFDAEFSEADLFKVAGEYKDAKGNAIGIPAQVNEEDGYSTATFTSMKKEGGYGEALKTAKIGGGTNSLANGGRGIITEIYDAPGKYIAVVIKPGFGEVAVEEDDDVIAYTIDEDEDLYGEVNGEDEDVPEAIIIGDVEDGDMVLWYFGKDCLYIEAVDTIIGKVTSRTSANVFTIDGKQYKLAYATLGGPGVDSKNDQTMFVDSFGNILGVLDESEAPSVKLALVLLVDDYQKLGDNNKVETVNTAIIVDLDGNVDTVETKTLETDNLGKLCTFEVNSGKYEFEAVSLPDDSDAALAANATWWVSGLTKVENGKATLTPTSGGVKRANSATKFIVANYDGAKLDGTVETYVGISNVPDFIKDVNGADLTKTYAVSHSGGNKGINEIANIVFVVDKVFSEGSNEFVFILGTYTETADGFEYDVIIEGARDKLVVGALGAAELDKNVGVLVESITIADGKVVGTIDEVEMDELTSLRNNGGLLYVNGAYIATIKDSAPVYVITVPAGGPGGATGEAKTAANYTTNTSFTSFKAAEIYYEVSASGEVGEIYIVIYK